MSKFLSTLRLLTSFHEDVEPTWPDVAFTSSDVEPTWSDVALTSWDVEPT